jgi:MaoC like domain
VRYAFTTDAIERWARFSGDYNPIHFDLARARAAGADDIIVHGMLALVHVQEQLHVSMQDTCLPTIKTFFRAPMVKNHAHKLDVAIHGNQRRFIVSSLQDKTQTMYGRCGFAMPEIAEHDTSNVFADFGIDGEPLREKIREFSQSFPTITPAWIFVSALAFSRFLVSETPLSVLRGRGQTFDPHERGTLMMQTSHAVAVNQAFAQKTLRDFSTPTDICCRLRTPIILANGRHELAGSFPFDITTEDRTIMQVEIGLLVRSATFLSTL